MPEQNTKIENSKKVSPQIVVLDAQTIGDDIIWPDFAKLGKLTLFDNTRSEQTAERINGANIVLTNKVLLNAAEIAAAPALQYIGTIATGYNQVDIKAAAARSIPVCNVPGYSTQAVLQHVFALILEFTNMVAQHSQAVHAGEWATSELFCFWKKPLLDLENKTMGIIGYGHIGSRVATLAAALGMKVLAYAPRPPRAIPAMSVQFASRDEVFEQADFISLHCPLTHENTHFVDYALLKRMKRTAFLINTARGPLINERDLAKALHEGLIAGAGLDVVETEPMPAICPLLNAPNCIITPHIAWATQEARSRLLQGVYANLEAFLNGKATNVVNGV